MYGDTDVMRKHAGRLRDQGADLRALADRLVAQTEAARWSGRAADALVDRIHERAAHLRDVANRHDGAAQSLELHLLAVERLKETIAAAELRAGRSGADESGTERPPSGHKDWLAIQLRDR